MQWDFITATLKRNHIWKYAIDQKQRTAINFYSTALLFLNCFYGSDYLWLYIKTASILWIVEFKLPLKLIVSLCPSAFSWNIQYFVSLTWMHCWRCGMNVRWWQLFVEYVRWCFAKCVDGDFWCNSATQTEQLAN